MKNQIYRLMTTFRISSRVSSLYFLPTQQINVCVVKLFLCRHVWLLLVAAKWHLMWHLYHSLWANNSPRRLSQSDVSLRVNMYKDWWHLSAHPGVCVWVCLSVWVCVSERGRVTLGEEDAWLPNRSKQIHHHTPGHANILYHVCESSFHTWVFHNNPHEMTDS